MRKLVFVLLSFSVMPALVFANITVTDRVGGVIYSLDGSGAIRNRTHHVGNIREEATGTVVTDRVGAILFRIQGDRITDRVHRHLGTIEGNNILDANRGVLGRIQGNTITDRTGGVLARVNSATPAQMRQVAILIFFFPD